MEIRDFLSPIHTRVDVNATDKSDLLRELSNQAGKALNVASDRILTELLKREELGSTGTGGGVAVPHARMPEVREPFGMLVRLRQAIQFDAIDGQPVDILFLLLLPAAPAGDQLHALASVARRLRDLASVRHLRRASSAAELFAIVTQRT